MQEETKIKPVLFEYFKDTANVLLAQYDRSKQQNASDNLGKNRESFCSDFLLKVLPAKLSVKSGEIWDSSGNKTGQQDIILLRDDAPALHIGSDDIYLSEGVFSVIEIKSNLTREKLIEAGNNLEKVSKLKINSGVVMSSGDSLHRPLRIIFAYTGATWETLYEEIVQRGWTDLFDLICILDRGVLITKGRLLNWDNDKTFQVATGKTASLAFLYFYLVSYGSSFMARSLVLAPYFEPLNAWGEGST